jgi:AraC-like DNA-binding protein
MLASKTETYPEFLFLCIVCAVYLFADACHATQAQGSPLDTGSLIASLFAGPCIIPLIIMYMQKLLHNPRRHWLSMMWILVPTVLFTGGILLYFLNFEARINTALNIITGPIFHYTLAAELLVLLIYIIKTSRYNRILPGNLFSFLFRGKPISLVRLQIDTISLPLGVMVLRILLSDNLYTATQGIAIASAAVITISLFIFALNALFGVRSIISWNDFRYLIRFNYSKSEKHEAIDIILNELLDEAEEDTLKSIQERLREHFVNNEWQPGENYGDTASLAGKKIALESNSWEEGSLLAQFQSLMMDKKVFLQPKLSLDDVAEELHSNKTYVSKMVNNTYNMGFPELVNTMRIDYAEQYILSHREAKQSEVALNSGFISASAFNTVFKKVTGVTPKVWLASVDNK